MNDTSYASEMSMLMEQRSELRHKLKEANDSDKPVIEKRLEDLNAEIKSKWDKLVRKAVKDSIAHWERMIAYAEKQALTERPSGITMKIDIGEVWTGFDCSLCNLFKNCLVPSSTEL